MKILAIDTSLETCAACISGSGQILPYVQETHVLQRGHDQLLLPMIERLMQQAELSFPELNRVAVTIGPGSFTGIRIGLAAARAIGLACSIPVVGISTFSALAASLLSQKLDGTVVAAIDAAHGNLYIQAFTKAGLTLLSPRLARARDVVRLLSSGPLHLVGSGAPLLAIEAWAAGLKANVKTASKEAENSDISYVARIGLLSDPANALPVPFYLKEPSAKLLAPSPCF